MTALWVAGGPVPTLVPAGDGGSPLPLLLLLVIGALSAFVTARINPRRP